ncbi:hypothetical protein SAMN02745704_00283 [Paucidesulfovibrio gracilis DSM 16080]|uniref:Uncharacterized protein n=1 Tax=Paucidesulfovibrio gracilis DSM 16080 TaxID=1121449 RepID=A0A1T4W4N6_9BACT|nr:hypothetical protein [Paucidesulfovibrio gracilis]SKA72099.1 hypothetical protein SAMN02745704_00283 [Paucidesulfovibrio gracilis DSM 16080]
MADLDIRIPDPDDSYTIRIAPGYISITDHNKPKVDTPKKVAPKTKKIPAPPSRSTFTEKSRRSFKKALNEIKLTKLPTHYIVLTVPNASQAPKDWKRGVGNLRRRMIENFPRCWFFWRLMPEKQRGLPILHLLGSLNDPVGCDELQELLTKWWSKINDIHWTVQPRVVRVQEVTGPHDRLFKKMSCAEMTTQHNEFYEAWGKLGKRWDRWNGKNIPYDVVEKFTVKHACHHEIKRVLMDSVEQDINEIEGRLRDDTDYDKRQMLANSLNGKRQFLNKLAAMDDDITFLDREHMDLVWETIREFSE